MIEDRRAGRQEVRTPGFGDPARNRIAAKALCARSSRRHVQNIPAPRGRRFGHPVERLDIVDERGPVEEAHLRDKGRAVARQGRACPRSTLDHRAFLAADIGPGAAAKVDVAGARRSPRPPARRSRRRRICRDGRIFVAHIDEAGLGLDRPGGDQHAFEEDMRRRVPGSSGP